MGGVETFYNKGYIFKVEKRGFADRSNANVRENRSKMFWSE